MVVKMFKNKELYEKIKRLHGCIEKLNTDLFEYKQFQLLSQDINDKFEQIMQITRNKNIPFVITSKVVYRKDSPFPVQINVFGYIPTDKHCHVPIHRIYSDVIYKINDFNMVSYIYLKDNISILPDQGFGSLMMESFLRLLKHMGFSCFVKGWLSPIDGLDKENDARRRHYYKKFGFDITEDDFVCLDLSKSDKTSDNGKEKTNDKPII